MLRKFNLQLFAEPGEGAPEANPEPKPGKVWTDDYVMGIREEAKQHRLAKKKYESLIRTAFELKDDDVIDDSIVEKFKNKITNQVSTAMQKANERLLAAEIRTLEGYDVKLVERLIDRSKISVGDDGTVTGLKEAVEALLVEFPQIKKSKEPAPGAPNPPGDNRTELDKLKDQLSKAVKLEEKVALKQRIFQLEQKG